MTTKELKLEAPKNKQINVRIDTHYYVLLEKEAQTTGNSVSGIVRDMIEYYFDEEHGGDNQ